MINADDIRDMKPEITAEMFKAATGLEPRMDDLERCNCPLAGEYGHWSCGWNFTHNKPNFMIGPVMKKDL